MQYLYKLSILLVLVIQTYMVDGQQLPTYSQYTFNKFLLNPAAAGSEGYTTISLVAREQWVGFKGTPKTHAITVDSRILRNSFISKNASIRKKKRLSSRSGRVGWAGHIFNDHYGPLDRTGIEGTYAYHIPLNESQISFGLSGVFYQFKLNKEKVELADDGDIDPLIDGVRGTLYIPDANFGVLYTCKDYFAGISVMQIFQSSIHFGDDESDYRLKRNINILGGYFYEINQDFSIEPSMLWKIPSSSISQLDVNVKVTYKSNYWGGLSYRTGNAIIVYFGAKFDKFFFGYGFDYNFSDIGRQTYGSHEFMAAIKFGDTARRYRWLNTY